MYLKFSNYEEPIECTVVPNGNLVTLKFKDKVIVNDSGFRCYLDKECNYDVCGDSYIGFNTIYKNDEETAKYNGYQLSNDGSVWVKPKAKVNFYISGSGSLDGETAQEVYDYEDLEIPTPVPDENNEFTGWSPEIPTNGEIEGNKTFTAVFVSTLPPPEPEPTLEDRVLDVEMETAMLTECVLEMSSVIYA